MKNKMLVILLCGFIIFGVIGCSKNKNESNVGEQSNIKIYSNNVFMSIKKNTLANTGTTLIIENNSDKTLCYGDAYEIEIKQNGKWYKLNGELAFNEPLWKLEEKKSNEIKLNWEYGYGKLAKGKYRIIKEVYFENEEENELNFYISAEFTIE